MQGDIVTAAKWLGASLVLASMVLVGGSRWGRTGEGTRQIPEPDSAVRQASVEELTRQILTPPPSPDVILGPTPDQLPDPAPTLCVDPPSEAEVWAKLPGAKNVSTEYYQTRRENVRFLIEKTGEKVDPCKNYPLAGRRRLIHCHYKCTIYFDEVYWSDYPVPFNHVDHRVETVYLDKDRLARCDVPATR